MATQHATEEADIRQRIDQLVGAIRAMDLEGVKPIYAPGIVSFDIVPPLRHVGAEAQWQNWADVFTAYQRPLGYKVLILWPGSCSRAQRYGGDARLVRTIEVGR
jgi:ketosteroid isomerase-like protein